MNLSISSVSEGKSPTPHINISEEMKSAGLSKTYADVNVFPNKPTIPFKNHLRAHII
jgi:hypothetical protein